MKTETIEICRLNNGSIDIDHYIRHCHRERSVSAHRAIGRSFNMPRKLIEKFFLRWVDRNLARNAPEPAE
jgi:hypothetical protein